MQAQPFQLLKGSQNPSLLAVNPAPPPAPPPAPAPAARPPQEVLHKSYELYRDERSGFSYAIPDGTEVEVFRKAIEELPATEGPEVFGLHSNADIAFRTSQVGAAVAYGGGEGESRGRDSRGRWFPEGASKLSSHPPGACVAAATTGDSPICQLLLAATPACRRSRRRCS